MAEMSGALSGDAFDIGLHVEAIFDEFQGQYPFDRVFHAHELAHALKWVGKDLEKASALIPSIVSLLPRPWGVDSISWIQTNHGLSGRGSPGREDPQLSRGVIRGRRQLVSPSLPAIPCGCVHFSMRLSVAT